MNEGVKICAHVFGKSVRYIYMYFSIPIHFPMSPLYGDVVPFL